MASGYFTGGTVSVSNGGTAVTGTGTAFTQVQAGGTFEALGLQVTIDAVASNTALTLALPWPGATQTDYANYLVKRQSDGAALVVQNEQKLGELLDALGLRGATLTGDGPPGIGVGTDDDIYFDKTALNVYEKVSGAWSLIWTGTITSPDVSNLAVITQAAYDALGSKDVNTLYVTTAS